MILRASLVKSKSINNLVEKHTESLEKFWGIKLKKEPILTLLNSRKEIDSIRKSKTDRKLVGWFWQERNIFILDPSKFKRESVFSKKDFERILLHEISHLFFYQIAKSSCPAWLNEGLACYLAGQTSEKEKYTIDDISQLIGCYYEFDRNIFNVSYALVEKLINYKGKKKFIELIESIAGNTNEKHFKSIFKKIYKLELNKDSLYKLLN